MRMLRTRFARGTIAAMMMSIPLYRCEGSGEVANVVAGDASALYDVSRWLGIRNGISEGFSCPRIH